MESKKRLYRTDVFLYGFYGEKENDALKIQEYLTEEIKAVELGEEVFVTIVKDSIVLSCDGNYLRTPYIEIRSLFTDRMVGFIVKSLKKMDLKLDVLISCWQRFVPAEDMMSEKTK